ncbi:MAG: response regulator transcription factor [Streptomycetaceae bacterium]|nr:response regulator transcription factor [Streptomycetaceae bacterium]
MWSPRPRACANSTWTPWSSSRRRASPSAWSPTATCSPYSPNWRRRSGPAPEPPARFVPESRPAEEMMMTPIRVFLLDDHEIVRRGLSDLLAAEPDIEVVGESGSAAESIRRIPALNPDVAVLDGRLPDGSGIDVCREVRSRFPHIQALILTSYDDEDALFSAIMAGAAGYVLKQIRGTDLVDGIRRVAAGQSLLDPVVTAKVLDRVRTGNTVDPRLADLSAREREVLGFVTQGLTNRQIALRMSLAEKTVKNYVSALLNKLGLERRVQAAVFATEVQQAKPHRTG